MAGIALSGLASGVDTSAIIDQLVAIDRQSSSRIQLQQAKLTARDTGLKDVQGKLSALRSAAQELRAPALWADQQAVESSSPAQVAVQRTSGAGTGASSIRVVSLAASFQHTYAWAPTAAARTLTLTPSGGAPTDVSVGPNASLDDVVSAINASSTASVYAAAVRTVPSDPASARLVLSSRTTGAASHFTLADDGVPVTDVASRAGRDATYFLDGATDPAELRTSASNVVDDAVPGLRLTLKATTATDVSITVGPPAPDTETVKARVAAFVSAYNALVTTIRDKTTEQTVPNPTTTSEALKGQLFGDRGLTGLLNTMRAGTSSAVVRNATGTDELLDLGISTGAIGGGRAASTGTLVLDDAKLAAQLAADPRAVQRLLGGTAGADGFAQRIEGIVQQQIGATDLLDSTGELDQRLQSSVDQQRTLSATLTANETRLTAKQQRLKAQFAAMESALQASQTQQAWLTGQLGAL